MPIGRRLVPPLAVLLSATLLVALGGCATPGAAETRHAERQAVIARWNRCLEREGARLGLADLRGDVERGCEGHRRDVVDAFPPHMTPRVQRSLDIQAARHLRARLGERDPLASALIDVLSPG